ncbi:MAG: hypothetical protein FJ388_25310 [Verrucomicrobia bacterium]|nr:hypothetical protein [Verrucomicrobiota bacterium]
MIGGSKLRPRVAGALVASALLDVGEPAAAPSDDNMKPPETFNSVIPEMAGCRQLILVTTSDWASVAAKLELFERSDRSSRWRRARKALPAVIGKNGLAWGIGLHGTFLKGDPVKREGDGCAPAGVFRLHEAFGHATPKAAAFIKFPYTQVTIHTVGVDDPDSRYYNRLVDDRQVRVKDWKDDRSMLRPGAPYEWGLVVEHNWKPHPGFGSCIFFHRWQDAGHGTSGCTAMAPENLLAILRWLDVSEHPLLVQLPQPVYEKMRRPWTLP